MIYATIILFALAAVLGLTILIKWLSNRTASKTVIYAHGAIAAIALITLVVWALQNPDNYPQLSLILFLVGAIGGFYLFYSDQKRNVRPVPVAFIHALLGVAGFVLLLLYALG